jgi:hypothetical protein
VISKYGGLCFTCYRPISKGDEIQYKRGRGIRHPVCPPISTADLLAGRERYYEVEALAVARAKMESPYARHDAANAVLVPAVRAPLGGAEGARG